jgi:hypothetical protein
MAAIQPRAAPVLLWFMLGACGDPVEPRPEPCTPVAIAPWTPAAGALRAPGWSDAEPLADWVEANTGFAARYGGVVVVLPDQDDSANRLALRIREANGSWTLHRLSVGAGRVSAVTPFAARDGSIHLVWARSSALAAGANPSNPRAGIADQIVHARWVAGEASPEEILVSSAANVSPPIRIVEDDEGGLHFVASWAAAPMQVPAVYYLRYRNGGWSTPVRMDAGFYSDLAITRAGEAVITYNRIGGLSGGSVGQAINPIFMMQTPDGCPTTPVLIHQSGRRADLARVAASMDGSLHVVWPQDLTGNQFADDVWHSMNVAGSGWSDPISVAGELPGIAGLSGLVADHGGGVHLTFGHFSTRSYPPLPPSTPFYARHVSEAGWTVVREPLGVTDGFIRAAVDEHGRVHLLIRGKRAGEPAHYYVPPAGG